MATNAHKRVDEHLKQQIITTCGDANVLWGTKHIDPALCIYVGAYLMCIDNKHLNKWCRMGGMQTHQQNWNHCIVRSTNTSIEMCPGITTKDKYNKYTTSSTGSSNLENKIVNRFEGS